MHEYVPGKVAQVKLVAKSCHKNHRKLQPLALMHRHYPYYIVVLAAGVRLTEVTLPFLQTLNKSKKPKQPFVRRSFKLVAAVKQRPEVRLSLSAARQCADIQEVAGIPIDFLHQLRQAAASSHVAPML
ncbi:MAG: hypothetical protein DDT39_00921 [Firmicutes bacterium]|nr:hypothetical protein [candidate division NPL-UPA2 bacterium]